MKILIVISLLMSLNAIGQLKSFTAEEQRKINDLHTIINNPLSHDTSLASTYLELAEMLIAIYPDTAMAVCFKAKKIAEKALSNRYGPIAESDKDFKVKRSLLISLAKSLSNLGVISKSGGNIGEALEYFHKCLKIREAIGEKKAIAMRLNEIGFIYNSQGDITKGLEYFHKSLKIHEEMENKIGMALGLNNIGFIYNNQGNIPLALDYWNHSLMIREEIDDKEGIAMSLNNIGSIYYNRGDINQGLTYFHKSLKIQEEIGDQTGVARSFNNIGYIYKSQGDLTKGLEFYHKSLNIYEEIGNKRGVSSSLTNIGFTYYLQGQLALAEKNVRQSLQISEKLGYPDDIKWASELLHRIYNKTGQYKKALSMYELHILMRDSINNERTQKAAIKQNMQYEYEKKSVADSIRSAEQQNVLDAQITAQQAQLIEEKTFKYSLFAGLGLVALFSLFVMNRLKVTGKQKRVIELKNNALSERNIEIVRHKQIVEEKNKEVLDSITYAERIQSAILPPLSLVKQLFPQSFIFYKPKDIVAGDFYWLENVEAEIYFSAADCTGHGVPGAMMSVMCSNALTKCVKELGLTKPGEILDATTKIIEGRFERSEQMVLDGMDLALCKLNLKTKKLEYAGANNPLWIIRKANIIPPSFGGGAEGGGGKTPREQAVVLETKADDSARNLIEVKADKQPIGRYYDRKPYTNQQLQLQKGDTIYIFSDGYVDQFGGPKGKKFKSKPFKNLLLSIAGENMVRQNELIDKAFEDWRGENEQVDDVCIIGVKI